MDMLRVFHMNGGEGEASYAKNCTIQSKILSVAKQFVEAAMHDFLSMETEADTITIAELGCSSGPTALEAVSRIMDVVELRRRKSKFMVYLVDLPSNDFNEVFTLLPSFQNKLREEKGKDFGPCYVVGLPGNFYERLVPDRTLHFVHSSSSLHWLKQAPPELDGKDDQKMINKGKIHMSVTSPRHVTNAYQLQFRNDFMSFLKCRAEEVVSGGRMVLSFVGRKSIEPSYDVPLELMAQSLLDMVSQGLVEEEKVDSLNLPYYAPCLEEVKQLIEEETSFYGDHFQVVEVDWSIIGEKTEDYNSCKSCLTNGATIAKTVRAVTESMLEHHFGGAIMDDLFLRYGKIWDAYLLSHKNPKSINLVISLVRM